MNIDRDGFLETLRRLSLLLLLLAAGAFPTAAQESASYRLDEHTFNAGGRPADGEMASSASYRISLDSIGSPLAQAGTLSAPSCGMSVDFVPTYSPPGEVEELRLAADHQTLSWIPEPTAGAYNLYRGLLSNVSGLGYGECEQQDLTAATTTDASVPPGGDGYFYLVTAQNRLAEEGTKGWDSAGSERPNLVACP